MKFFLILSSGRSGILKKAVNYVSNYSFRGISFRLFRKYILNQGLLKKYGIINTVIFLRQLNKGKILVYKEQYKKAIIVFEKVLKKWPDELRTYIFLGKCAEYLEDWKSCLKYTEKVTSTLSDLPDIYGQRIKALMELERYGESEILISAAKNKWPDNILFMKQHAKFAKYTNRPDLACSVWKDITIRFPDDQQSRLDYILALIKDNKTGEADELCKKEDPNLKDRSFISAMALIRMTKYDWDGALMAVRSLPGFSRSKIDTRILEAEILFKSNKENCLAEAIGILETLHRKFPKKTYVKSELAKYYIYASRIDDAKLLIKELYDEHEHNLRILFLYAWSEYVSGKPNETKKIWDDLIRQNIFTRLALLPYKGEMERIDNNLLPARHDRIILFTCLRNEMNRLPWFFEYYRKLGVEHFFIVDNGSDDGSTSFLKKQKDVHLFWTEDNYGEAASGMQWINSLVNKYGKEHWCMYVDVDEALIFPGIEQKSLRYLVNYMRNKGQEAFRTFMLDMYPPNTSGIFKNEVVDPMTLSPYFDNNYRFFGSHKCPYVEVTGGIRNNLFHERVSLTKTPIIVGNKGIKFLSSSHRITPARVSDVTGVLLHYKLMSDLAQKSVEESELKLRKYFCTDRHLNYKNVLEKLGDNYDLLNPLTLRYESSEQLVELGLMSKPEDFD